MSRLVGYDAVMTCYLIWIFLLGNCFVDRVPDVYLNDMLIFQWIAINILIIQPANLSVRFCKRLSYLFNPWVITVDMYIWMCQVPGIYGDMLISEVTVNWRIMVHTSELSILCSTYTMWTLLVQRDTRIAYIKFDKKSDQVEWVWMGGHLLVSNCAHE